MNIMKTITVLEKSHYPFRRYPKKCCDTLLFPGCAFPSQFPKTMDCLARICAEHGVGLAYDCCGLPLIGFGRQKRAVRIKEEIAKRLKKNGCKRVAFMCPNCFEYLKDDLGVSAITVFDLLKEFGIESQGCFKDGMLYVPCPDRECHTIEQSLRASYDLAKVRSCASGCCGLRPDIALKGPVVSEKCGQSVIKAANGEQIYAYCASCAGQMKRLGEQGVRHAVSVILGVDEEPDSSRAFANRAKRKFVRENKEL